MSDTKTTKFQKGVSPNPGGVPKGGTRPAKRRPRMLARALKLAPEALNKLRAIYNGADKASDQIAAAKAVLFIATQALRVTSGEPEEAPVEDLGAISNDALMRLLKGPPQG